MKNIFFYFLFILLNLPSAYGDENSSFILGPWLNSGTVTSHTPAFADTPGIDGEEWRPSSFLETLPGLYEKWIPEEGNPLPWHTDEAGVWSVAETDEGWIGFSGASEAHHQITWAAAYIAADRFVTASLNIQSNGMARAFLNGEEIGKITTLPDSAGASPHSLTIPLELIQGKHLLLIKALHPAGHSEADWRLKARLDDASHLSSIQQSLYPKRNLMQRDLSNAPRASAISIHPEGTFAAIQIRDPQPPDGTSESRLEILRLPDGTRYRQFSGDIHISGVQWIPDGSGLSYTKRGENGTDLFMIDLHTLEHERLLKNVPDFTGYRWSPKGDFVIFGIQKKHEPGKEGVIRYHGLQDRRPGYYNRTSLYQVFRQGKSTRRLTAGELTGNLSDFHPDGTKIILTRYHENYVERPFGKQEYAILDLHTLEADSLFSLNFGGQAKFSPDGKRILVTGGPTAFGEAGVNLPDTLIPNEYDTQAYLYDLESRDVVSLTLDFDPEIHSAYWESTGRYIFFVATEKAYRTLYRFDVRRNRFTKIQTDADVISSFSLANTKPFALYTASGASDPGKVYYLDLTSRNPKPRLIYDPGTEAYRHIRFGELKPWTFTNAFDEKIDGHVYYPPDFEPEQQYPLIVYYYGGTNPVSRAYGGRYPFELYASKGYVVYVLQPSGATGFGQEFAARHVNDWGKIAGNEIIMGVSRFLDEHSYIDRNRVGAIGASYGGFMTMYLLTQTNLFAAAVSHAGISNLTSYWGEGFWGYQYSGIATAYSFPWNRPDIYVGQSPVFQADHIHTPLLLITGMDDTNVPAGESLQMFTALKLLGRDVAFVAVEGQDHHILDYKKFILWKEAILSWFDKWLKEEPEWWQHSHGK